MADAGQRHARVLVAIEGAAGASPVERLSVATAELLGVTGVGLTLTDGLAHPESMVSSAGARRGDELQATTGEGPGVDAHRTGRHVLAGDLERDVTWPAFGPAAVTAGIAAAFAFPLQVGALRLGSLNLYRERAGDLEAEQVADALVLADISLNLLLSLQAQAPADELHHLLQHQNDHGWEVHQATGMIAVQLGATLMEASVRLRAHAFATSRPLGEVAADVVARRLVLDT